MSSHRNRDYRGGRGRAHSVSSESLSSFFSGPKNRARHKTAQLCRQVERVLALALPACAEPAIRALVVQGVEPGPDSSRLLIRVCRWSAAEDAAAPEEVYAAFGRAMPWLRHQVAESITRKRAPELTFLLVSAESEAGHD